MAGAAVAIGAGTGIAGPRFSIASLAAGCIGAAAAHDVIITVAINPIANRRAFDIFVVFIS
jgi:hypothetical protein